MMADSEITAVTIIRAVHSLGGRREPVSAERIAEHLKTTVKVVRPLLNDLRRQRIMRSCQRQGRTVWEPWD